MRKATERSAFKTWAVETAVGLWGALSMVGMCLVEGVDGSVKLFPFCIPSIISFVICSKVFEALEKRGYFKELTTKNK